MAVSMDEQLVEKVARAINKHAFQCMDASRYPEDQENWHDIAKAAIKAVQDFTREVEQEQKDQRDPYWTGAL